MKKLLFSAALMLLASVCHAETIGSVDTEFKFIGPNHKVEVDVADDPRVQGVSCYLALPKTGGVKGAFGLADEKNDDSVACRQVGDIHFTGPMPQQEEVFSERSSLVFKHVRVVRMVDAKRNTLVYLIYTDRLIDGSPKSSISAVPVPASLRIPLK
jgi:CreA protein